MWYVSNISPSNNYFFPLVLNCLSFYPQQQISSASVNFLRFPLISSESTKNRDFFPLQIYTQPRSTRSKRPKRLLPSWKVRDMKEEVHTKRSNQEKDLIAVELRGQSMGSFPIHDCDDVIHFNSPFLIRNFIHWTASDKCQDWICQKLQYHSMKLI